MIPRSDPLAKNSGVILAAETNEPASEDIRNALTILMAYKQLGVSLHAKDMDAVINRLKSAVVKLERK